MGSWAGRQASICLGALAGASAIADPSAIASAKAKALSASMEVIKASPKAITSDRAQNEVEAKVYEV